MKLNILQIKHKQYSLTTTSDDIFVIWDFYQDTTPNFHSDWPKKDSLDTENSKSVRF